MVNFLRGDQVITSYLLHQRLADAVVFRLTLMAGLDVTSPRPQTGRCEVGYAGSRAQLFVYRRAEGPGVSIDAWLVHDRVAPTTGLLQTEPLPEVLPPGTRIANHTILEEVGDGGMGVVYRARHEGLRIETAIKLLRRCVLEEGQDAVSRFFIEAQAAARVRHPGIVSVYDVGLLRDGRPYLVMELLDGESLRDRIWDEGALHPRQVVSLGAQIAAALHAAHQHGVVHRDVSPGNILLTGTTGAEFIKLVDFGTAHLVGEPSPDDEDDLIFGTPCYISPEQACGHTGDARADLYSFGAVLYEMVSGEPPFDGETAAQIVMQHVHADPMPLQSPWGEVPPRLANLVNRLLMKKPEQRYQCGADVVRALAEVYV